MKQYDALIIGAGPAGAAAAYDLAQAGKKVLLLEKDRFPRFKPCAGMLTIKSLNRLNFSIKPVVQWSTDTMEVSNILKSPVSLKASSELVVTTVRSELDEYCLNQAIEAGAELAVHIKGFKRYKTVDSKIEVQCEDGTIYHCEYLIGADGAHSKVRKQSAQFEPDRTAVALEGRIAFSELPDAMAIKGKRLVFDFNVANKGYAWLIPKRDHVNVGVYTRRPDENPISKKMLQDYTEKQLGTRKIDELLGFPVGTGGEYFTPADGKVFLVGDAAGYAEAIFGEGIHNAIKSGQFAAQSIIEANEALSTSAGERYRELVEAVRTDVWWCRWIAKAFYKMLTLGLWVLTKTPVKTTVIEGFAGGLTIKECLKALSPFHEAPVYEKSATMRSLNPLDRALNEKVMAD